jgi:hypothetical protein
MNIENLITERLILGKRKYGHGVRVNDDTITWGTKKDSWMQMAEEEVLDCIIYVIADYIRWGRQPEIVSSYLEYKYIFHERKLEATYDDNDLIMYIYNNINAIESPKHKFILESLTNILFAC